MKIKKGNKIKIVKLIFFTIVCLCFTYNIIFLLNTTITQKDYMKLFGIAFLNMESELMENELSRNDFVIIKDVNENELQEGDVIAYTVNNQIRINKIINIKDGYTTKSNKSYYPDIERISHTQVIGKKIVNISFMGILLKILQSKIISFMIFIFLIFIFITNMYKHKKRIERAIKKEQLKKFC